MSSLVRCCKRLRLQVQEQGGAPVLTVRDGHRLQRVPSLIFRIRPLSALTIKLLRHKHFIFDSSHAESLPPTLRTLKIETGEAVDMFFRCHRAATIGPRGLAPRRSMAITHEDYATILPLQTMFPILETLKLRGTFSKVAQGLLPHLPSSLTVLSIKGAYWYERAPLELTTFPPHLTKLALDFGSIPKHAVLPPALSSLHLPQSFAGLSYVVSFPHLQRLYLATENGHVPSEIFLPQLYSFSLAASVSQWMVWLPLLHNTPIQELIALTIHDDFLNDCVRIPNRLPPTLKAFYSAAHPTLWNHAQMYTGQKKAQLKNLLEEGPQSAVRFYFPTSGDFPSVVGNPLLQAIAAGSEPMPRELFQNLPHRLLHIDLSFDVTVVNGDISYFPASLLSVNLLSNTNIGDDGIARLPCGLLSLQLGGDRIKLTRKSAALLPRSLNQLVVKFLDSWQDEDILLLSRTLTVLTLKNAIHLTDRAIGFLPDSIQSLNFKNNRRFTTACLRHLPSACTYFVNTKNANYKRSDYPFVPYNLAIQAKKLKCSKTRS